jgi:hypothetical protein
MCVATVLLLALCTAEARSDDPKKPALPASKPSDDTASAKKRFASAADSAVAGKEIAAILKAAKGSFSSLLADDNTSLALFAAWDAAKQRSGQAEGADWNWFVGFLQGRTGLSPPLRWEIALMSIHYGQFKQWNPNQWAPRRVLEDYLKKGDVLEKWQDDTIVLKRRRVLTKKAGFWVPSDLTAQLNDRDLAITVGEKEQILVAASVLKDAVSNPEASGYNHLNATVAADRAFVAFFDEFGERYPLLCIDRNSGKVLWKAEVWALATEQIPARSGSWAHNLILEFHKKSVVLYGIGVGCYVEAFDIETGKPLYRFASNAWYAHRETD